MFSILVFLLLSSVKAQYYYRQQQYPYNNYNLWSLYSPHSLGWNLGMQQNRISVRGNLLSDDISALPLGSQIIVSLADVSIQDAPSRPLNTYVLYGSYRFPIAFDIPYSIALVQASSNGIRQFAIQARIEKDGQLLYINDRYTPVELIPPPINPINVYMKKIGATTIPENAAIYTVPPPITSSMFICRQIPDVGPCRAHIEQFYFNTQLRSCEIFIWGGCDGNQNRFNTKDECERACSSYRRRLNRNNAKQRWF